MKNTDSYKQIVKSTSLVGGTQILNILIGIIRMKFVATLLGPAGIGIAGIFQTIIDLARDATGFGISFSGVKNIAEASSSSDPVKFSKTVMVLRRWALGTGLLGMVVIIVFSLYFSRYSFGNSNYTLSIIFLSVILLTSSISSNQIALLQGMRKIGQMAKANLIGTLFGTFISLPLYWIYGVSGIVPGMIVTSFGIMFISWLYARKIEVDHQNLSIEDTVKEGLGMAKLGFFIVVNGFVATLSMYLIRALIRSHLELDSVGYFQAVWTISTIYINILLHAMLADYFPRLTIIQADNKASNTLINEQLEITLLVGTPMIAGMIIFAPLLLYTLYSSSFTIAAPILQWQMAGSFFTLLSWPLGVLYLSKNLGWYAVISETLRQAIYLSFIYFGWSYFGFTGLGIGFFIAAVFNALFVYITLIKISSFSFASVNLKYIFCFSIAILAILSISSYMAKLTAYAINGAILLVIVIYCFRRLDKLIGIKSIIKAKIPFWK
jgi:antigen flippase